MKLYHLAFAGAALVAASQASAATQVKVNSWSWAAGYNTGVLSYAPSQFNGKTLEIGSFSMMGTNLTNNAAVTLNTFCVDVGKLLTVPATYTVVPLSQLFSASQATNLSKLLMNVTPTNATQSAALQLAVWDIAFDKGPSYSANSGSFSTSGGNSDAARTLANTYLGSLANWSVNSNQSVQILYSGSTQSQIFLTSRLSPLSATPEPGQWALMIFGFGAVGTALRRQRRAAVRVAYA